MSDELETSEIGKAAEADGEDGGLEQAYVEHTATRREVTNKPM